MSTIEQDCNSIQYNLHRYQKDVYGNKWRYKVSPQNGGGINYFDTVMDLKKWIKQVKWIRMIQNV